MQTNPAVESNKNINGLRVRGISPVGKEKVCGGKDLPKSIIDFVGECHVLELSAYKSSTCAELL